MLSIHYYYYGIITLLIVLLFFVFYFISSFPFPFAFALGGLGFQFCVFVAGWRHDLRSEWPSITAIYYIIAVLVLLFTTNLNSSDAPPF